MSLLSLQQDERAIDGSREKARPLKSPPRAVVMLDLPGQVEAVEREALLSFAMAKRGYSAPSASGPAATRSAACGAHRVEQPGSKPEVFG